MSENTTIVILSDDENLTQEIQDQLENSPFSILGIAEEIQTIETMLYDYAPEMLLIRLKETIIEPVDAIYKIKLLSPRTKIILLSEDSRSTLVNNAIKAGVSTIFPINMGVEGLAEMMATLLDDEIYMPSFVASNLLSKSESDMKKQAHFPFKLTNREKMILNGFANNLTLTEICQKIDLPEEAVKAYTNNILKKLHFVHIARKQYENMMADYHSSKEMQHFT